MAERAATIYVCVSCRRPLDGGGDAFDQPGSQLVAALEKECKERGASEISVEPVECLAVCKRPCTISVTAKGKWSYLIGDLDPLVHAREIVDAAIAYSRSDNGIVPWKERPLSFQRGVVARVPPFGFKQPLQEELIPGGSMTSLAKVPCTIVTGFLGAGKTTLVRHVLQNANGRRLAVIVNEFGDIGIDGEILKGCGITDCPEDRIVELSNGCLCCTVADEFVPALSALLDRPVPPEHIVIETSGLALPKPLVQAFNWPEIASRVTVDGVVAVIDGAAVAEGRFADDPEAVARQRAADGALEHDNPLEEVYEDQLLCADLIVLNKTDLMTEMEREVVAENIRGAIPRAVKIVSTESGQIEPAILLGLDAAAESDLLARPSHHDADGEHDHDDFESFVVDLPVLSSAEAFVERLSRVASEHDVLRMKGFAEVEGKPMRLLVQGVGARFTRQYDRPWRPGADRRGRLVVIGETGLDADAIRGMILG
jgi:cobalamin biosynthesis protein CobW